MRFLRCCRLSPVAGLLSKKKSCIVSLCCWPGSGLVSEQQPPDTAGSAVGPPPPAPLAARATPTTARGTGPGRASGKVAAARVAPTGAAVPAPPPPPRPTLGWGGGSCADCFPEGTGKELPQNGQELDKRINGSIFHLFWRLFGMRQRRPPAFQNELRMANFFRSHHRYSSRLLNKTETQPTTGCVLTSAVTKGKHHLERW